MTKSRVVSDSGPLIAFAGVRRLDLIDQLYGPIAIPTVVASEIEPSIPELPDWIVVESVWAPPQQPLRGNLDEGEQAAIELALAQSVDALLIDDLKGRVAAMEAGLNVTGTVGIVIAAKRLGLIPIGRPLIDELLRGGLYLGERVYEAALSKLGE